MKKICIALASLMILLALVAPAAASGPSGAIGVYSVTACKDTTTVAVSVNTTYATNRLWVRVYVPNNQGQYDLRKETYSAQSGSGAYIVPVIVNYRNNAVDDGILLQITVQLQSGGGFDNIGAPITIYAQVADKNCYGKCSLTISTNDKAPASGVVTVRSHYGAWFRPEGWTVGAVPVVGGAKLQIGVPAISCGSSVRVWFYPSTGKDRTPKMLPAQYWPYEYAVTRDDGANPYTTSFAKGVKPSAPLEPDDPYAPKK